MTHLSCIFNWIFTHFQAQTTFCSRIQVGCIPSFVVPLCIFHFSPLLQAAPSFSYVLRFWLLYYPKIFYRSFPPFLPLSLSHFALNTLYTRSVIIFRTSNAVLCYNCEWYQISVYHASLHFPSSFLFPSPFQSKIIANQNNIQCMDIVVVLSIYRSINQSTFVVILFIHLFSVIREMVTDR